MEELKKNTNKIKDMEIQGATNVAIFGLASFNQYVQTLKDISIDHFFKKIEEANQILNDIRPTEPCLRNGLRYVINKGRELGSNSLNDIKEVINDSIKSYHDLLDEANKKIGEYGARRIIDGSTIMTHCHSTAVIEILKKAHEDGKRMEVIATETRPLFQGRKTVRRLSSMGIKVNMIVDSAMRWVAKNKNVDLILIGCDAITAEGTVLNKIGSRLLAFVAQENHIPFYVATTILKYNPDSEFGNLELIEMRSEKEVWDEVELPPVFKILNPAFETISRELISSLITEIGVFPPVLISEKFETHYPFLKRE